ncbi:MAG: DUF285 domain-containing protein [Lachnospiraceae bacterium]
MLKKYIKIIIPALLLSFVILTQILPGTGMGNQIKAKAAGNFNGAHGTSGDLTWSITKNGHLSIKGNGDYKKHVKRKNLPEWLYYRKYIKTAEVNVKNITSTRYMFYNCRNLKRINLEDLDTSKVTNMSHMFDFNNNYIFNINVKKLDLSGFDTSNVTDMSYMFRDCDAISIDVSSFDTSNVTDMSLMFAACRNLKSLDLSGFNTSNVTNMAIMFYACNILESLDLSSLNSLEKLCFFSNSPYRYKLPFSPGRYWINGNGKHTTKTAKNTKKKVVYTKVYDNSVHIPGLLPDINIKLYFSKKFFYFPYCYMHFTNFTNNSNTRQFNLIK